MLRWALQARESTKAFHYNACFELKHVFSICYQLLFSKEFKSCLEKSFVKVQKSNSGKTLIIFEKVYQFWRCPCPILFQNVLKMSHLYHKVFAFFVKVPEFVLMPCLIWFELFLWCCRMLSSLLLALYFCHVLPICIPNFGCDVLTLDLLLLSLSPVHPIWVAVVDCDAKNWLQFQTRWLMELPWELRSAGLISLF